MNASEVVNLPRRIAWAVCGLSLLPWLYLHWGGTFPAVPPQPSQLELVRILHSPERDAYLHRLLAGSFVHTLLEWSAVCVALFTAAFSFVHYYLRRDLATPVIGTALFFSGMIDAFHTLAADGLIGDVADADRFVPFTWSLSRTFNVCILIAGTAPFLLCRPPGGITVRSHDARTIVLVSLMYALAAYLIIHLCAAWQVPRAIYPDRIIPRPWDALPLVLYLLAGGIVFPRFHRLQPSLFSSGLCLSVIPHVIAQAHAALGSTAAFDGHAHAASILKILAYLVPLGGLLSDYARAYRAEADWQATRQQLHVARRIQQRLFPERPPRIDGFDLAGLSEPAEAVGGDFYVFIPLREHRWGIAVADVSGHEIGTALVMAQTHAYLRALTAVEDDLGRIAVALNRFLAEDVRDRMFVSLFLVKLDCHSGSFEYVGAGHEAHLITAGGDVRRLERLSPLLGILDEADIRTSSPLLLAPGDLLLMMTDGLFESRSAAGDMFGLDRAVELARSHRGQPAARIVAALDQAAADFRGGTPPKDDLTIVVVKRTTE